MIIKSFRDEYFFLSNFSPCESPIRLPNGMCGSTVEHCYQAAKVDEQLQKSILTARTPGLAKQTARSLPIREDWNEIKDGVMLFLLKQKFSLDTELARKLTETAPHRLEEHNNWRDQYWGVWNGVGLNKLGELLMLIRSELIFTGLET